MTTALPARFGSTEVAGVVPASGSSCSGTASARLRRIRAKEARRASIERCGAVPAAVPMWSSRELWTDDLRGAQLGKPGVISAATVFSVAVAMAEFADHATGRNVAVTNEVLAERARCSKRSVTTARGVLKALGFAVEAVRGHGSATTHTVGNRPSIWHLVSRRQPTIVNPPTAPQNGSGDRADTVPDRGQSAPLAVDTCDLPPSRRDRWSSPVENYSPSTRERAREENSSPKQTQPARSQRRYRATPRPLAVQRLAAGLVTPAVGHGPDNEGRRTALITGLERGHLGAICDAITTAGIDATAWTPKTLTAALDADARVTGWSWPDRIERPGPFLASRLRRLPARPDRTGLVDGGTAAGLEQSRRAPVELSTARTEPVGPTGPKPAQTAAGRAYARQLFAEQRQQRSVNGQTRQAVAAVRHSAPPAAPETAECAICGCTDAPRRRFLPQRRAHICDACFHGCGGEQARTGRVGTAGNSSAVPTCQ